MSLSRGGTVHKRGLIPAPMPSWLQRIAARISGETCIFGASGGGSDSTGVGKSDGGKQPLQANHILVNAYQPGEGIMPHEASSAGQRGWSGVRGVELLCSNYCAHYFFHRMVHFTTQLWPS